jgi:hypothetical protein
MQDDRVIEASTQISKESMGGQAVYGRVGAPADSPRESDA